VQARLAILTMRETASLTASAGGFVVLQAGIFRAEKGLNHWDSGLFPVRAGRSAEADLVDALRFLLATLADQVADVIRIAQADQLNVRFGDGQISQPEELGDQ
jgi:hypothetical protein